jgi:electron transfer flavoprotein alpha subunit
VSEAGDMEAQRRTGEAVSSAREVDGRRAAAPAPAAPPAAAPGPVLVVVEPLGDAADAADATARLTLAAEAARVAGALRADTRFVTWQDDPDVDLAALAAALAAAALRVAPVAVLVQDGDLGRQLAPLIAQGLGTAAVLGCSDVVVASAAAQCRSGAVGTGDAGRGAAGMADAAQSAAPLTFVKPIYSGWLEQQVRAAACFTPVVTLDLAGLEPTEAAAEEAAAALAEAEMVACPPTSLPRVRHIDTVAPDARSVDLVHAKRIVAAGMGTADEKLLAAVHELADLLEGSVGATRPMVDDGHLPKERLIGQTGRTVTPDLYVALGISGSPHHVAGVRRADRVLSINRDTRAPIFQFSDIGYVADLEAVLPALIAKIKKWRDAPAGDAPGGRAPARPARGGRDGR